ncbi:DUF881 domain-containing protein [Clostridium chrysemydis]|uniref:DUF881 domain-containing protein n=1 Tax=Clostridium chrysemydis TaxID=2665504 RepID=UPI0018844AC0|nr:DUF881 domain-containing protein [Clostridium chrysemydis]
MKKASGKFLVFISAVILGYLIVLNSNLGGMKDLFNLSAKEYGDAIEERSDLYKSVSSLKENNEKMKETIESYKNNDKDQDKIVEKMVSQLNDYGKLAGTTEVSGRGVVITINDGDVENKNNTDYEKMKKIFHDNDMALVINELRKSGAEAISINNRRVIPSTAVFCNWAFLGFEDGTTEYAPFKVYAIGDPDTLEASLLGEGSYIKELMYRELQVSIEKKEKIVMPAAKTIGTTDYMKESTN